MKRIFIILLSIFFFQIFATAQNYSRKWVSINDSLADELENFCTGVNAGGDTYTASAIYNGGSFKSHLEFSKINSSGKLEWQLNYADSASDKYLEPEGILIDSAGYIYITNIVENKNYDDELLTLKYDSGGNLIWRKRFYKADKRFEAPLSVALTRDNNIFIACNQSGSKFISYGIHVQLIAANGIIKYAKDIDSCTAYNCCVDYDNNTIVSGISLAHDEHLHKGTVWKFDNKGNLLATGYVNDPHCKEELHYVACDSANNIYTEGQSKRNNYDSLRIITVKFNSEGKQLWYKKQAVITLLTNNLLVDAAGNSWVTISKSHSWQTIKYDKAGKEVWNKIFKDYEGYYSYNQGCVLDSAGNVFIAGFVLAATGINNDFSGSQAIVGYNKNGQKILSDIYTPPTYGKEVDFSKIDIDGAGNIYSSNTRHNHYTLVLIKYGKTITNLNFASESKVLNNLKLYPNPVVNNVSVDFTTSSQSKNYKLIISDVSGNIVLMKQLGNTDKLMHLNVDVSNLKTGIYNISISDGENNVGKTFLKQ